MAAEEPQCQAQDISDGSRCQKDATHANGLFCLFHSKQAYGLYLGYKRRNAQLDAIDDKAPPYLRDCKVPLVNQNYDDLDDQKSLQEVHDHLFDKFRLLTRVINARKLHHQSFYSINYDYGHQVYLDKLIRERHNVTKALERVQKRIASVLYQQEQWFSWVRRAQDEEEASRDKEQKKVKLEAALFKRHWKKLQARLERARKKEESLKQDAYLEQAYRERMASSDEDDDEAWDPIEDVDNDKRNQYIELIKHFLWMDEPEEDSQAEPSPKPGGDQAAEPDPAGEDKGPSKKAKKRSKAKNAAAATKKKADAESAAASTEEDSRGQDKLLVLQSAEQATGDDNRQPDKGRIETEEEMRLRLSQGVKRNYDNVHGVQIVGTANNPFETYEKTAPMTEAEVEQAISDIREIKMLLFCRLLLAQANLLPAAVRAGSVQAFLDDPDVGETDLRDLCLKLEVPTLQDIRDACADFARDEETEAANDAAWETDEEDSDDEGGETWEDLIAEDARYKHLSSDDWFRNKIIGPGIDKVVDFTADTGPSRKMQVTVCGRSIWNHASEHSMSRHGWLQFSIIAKDCELKHAVQLCRSWTEFSDLNNLAWWQVFPTANWASWGGNDLMRQLQQYGFYPYFVDFEAQKYGRRSQVGGRSQLRRQHDIVETKNVLVGHMKRNDPITRRFLQYLLMRTGELLILVRDGKTGRVITAPPKDHLWTYRKKQGLGRASKNDWVNLLEMGPDYFELTNKHRDWRLGFEDYYDIFIWDFVPCESAMELYNRIILDLRVALRIAQPRDMYLHMKPIMQTLTRSPETMRTRPIQPGEDVQNLWDSIMAEGASSFRLFDIKGEGDVKMHSDSELADSKFIYQFYNEANVVEDQVLFPDELVEQRDSVPFREMSNGISRMERGIPPRIAQQLARNLEAIDAGEDVKALEASFEQFGVAESIPSHYVWETGLEQIRQSELSPEHQKLFERTGIDRLYTDEWMDELLEYSDQLEEMERERAGGFKIAFHDGDLEPGGLLRYFEVQFLLEGMLKTAHTGPTDWIVFIAEILDWLKARADYSEYAHEGVRPWPHRYVGTDAVEAFALIAMFFPELDVTSLVTLFLKAPHCKRFSKSDIFKPLERGKTIPDRRSRTSYKFRDSKFWSEWEEIMSKKQYFTDIYPFEWSLCVRPIIAHLYRAGVIAPAHLEAHSLVVSGIATANTEPHRPDKLDLFISYKDRYGNFNLTYPPHFVPPSRWPELLPLARKFASKDPAARFALIRLWSAPHFYPLMIGLNVRRPSSFLDSMGRSWEWRFVPKDLPGSEMSTHNTTAMRLDMFKKQFGDRVVHRGDLILVMGRDAADLLKYATAVTFVLQTKPWLREVDLHKSFINVGLDLLEELDPYWLD